MEFTAMSMRTYMKIIKTNFFENGVVYFSVIHGI